MKKPANPLENIAEEQVVLGKILQSEAAFFQVADVLQPSHFARPIHQQVFSAVRDILMEGKKLSLTLLQARIGDEYSEGDADGLSTMTLLTALLRDAENGDLEGVETLVDLWKRRTHIAELRLALKEAEDPNAHITDLIAAHETRLNDITLNGQAEPLQTIGQIAREAVARSRRTQSSGRIGGFDTGLSSLDEILGRMHPGDLGVIGARQGDAKTVLGVQIAEHAQAVAPSCIFEYEMDKLDLARRVLAGGTALSVSQIEEGSYDMYAAEEMEGALRRLESSRMFVDARPRLRIDQVRDRCMWLKRSKGLGVVVIDHLRLIRASGRFANKFDRIEHVTGELKGMAKDLEIAVIVLSQVTRMSQRDATHPEPGINDLDGGSSIEQDADWIIGLFRRDRWLKGQKPYDPESKEFRDWAEKMRRHKGRIEVTCLKRRRGEDGEMREFQFDGRAGLIREIER